LPSMAVNTGRLAEDMEMVIDRLLGNRTKAPMLAAPG
jgi:hypothetical protein